MMEKNEFKITDIDALANRIICSNCNKLLNISPIFCVQDDDFVCGRCIHSAKFSDRKQSRQYAYENIAQLLTYPCCNKKFGCNAVLNWNEVLDHEIVCTFQSVPCPIFFKDLFPHMNCTWVGNVKKVIDHIESSHKEYILNPPQFNFEEAFMNMNNIFFTRVGVQLVTIVIKYREDNKYYCLVMINGSDIESQCYRYQLELFDEKKDNSLILRKNRLEPLLCMLENLENFNKMLEIDLNKIKEMLKDSASISGCFGIVRKNRKEISQISGISKDHEMLNGHTTPPAIKNEVISPDEPMLQELKCPVCNEFMIPPIYICQTGHSLCFDCKSKLNKCPNCRSELLGARNFTLEKLTTKVHYPCRNREIGCSFASTSDKIRMHEGSCELSETPCILKCGHRCLRPIMYNHVLETHPNKLFETDVLHKQDISGKKQDFYALYVNGELFRFSIKGSGMNPYKFNVQHLGMIQDDPKFRYQLQFVDPSPQGQSLTLTYVCQCLTDVANKAHTNAAVIPWELLKPLVVESTYLNFKLIITKI